MAPERVVVRVEALLDLEHVRNVVERVRLAPSTSELVLDFAPSAQCRAFPLSLVARAVEGAVARVSLWGLSRQDLRILRYLGLAMADEDGAGRADSP